MQKQFNFIGNDDSGPEDYLNDWDLECVTVKMISLLFLSSKSLSLGIFFKPQFEPSYTSFRPRHDELFYHLFFLPKSVCWDP